MHDMTMVVSLSISLNAFRACWPSLLGVQQSSNMCMSLAISVVLDSDKQAICACQTPCMV